jgi:5-(carboxyamino)imidazole ribonucleotide synthase
MGRDWPVLSPRATIGILGGGQLGRMIALAAARYGLKTHVFAPDDTSPAFDVATRHTLAAYEDETALAAFAAAVDVVTYEFENVPAATAAFLEAHVPLRPGARALGTTQDRLVEKSFIAGLGIPTAPFEAVDELAGLDAALTVIGRPAVLKTRRFGYDGKGQALIGEATAPAVAWDAIGRAPAILEGFVPFSCEISVVAAHGLDGSFAAFDVCENTHRDHILDVTSVPARLSEATAGAAVAAAKRIADALDYVGVLAVELFVVTGKDGAAIMVNEIAPRVHNSGHWTIEGADTSQFEQHVRAICGWPLGSPRRLGAATMANLIGDDVKAWPTLIAEPGAHLHLYGKRHARPGRKMGHVTRIRPEHG